MWVSLSLRYYSERVSPRTSLLQSMIVRQWIGWSVATRGRLSADSIHSREVVDCGDS